MKAVVLAAGAGTRMWPLATTSPKHLLGIAGQPIISYGLKALAATGIKEVIMVVGFKSEQMQSTLGAGGEYGVEIRYLKQRRWTGTASAINLTRESVGDDPFLAMYGDLLVRQGAVSSVINKAREVSKVVGVVELDESQASEYGVIAHVAEKVTGIVEKPKVRRGAPAWVNSGIYVLDGDIFRSIKKTARSTRNEYELTTSLQKMIGDGQSIEAALISRQDWMDIGRPWDLLEANERILRDLPPKLNGDVEAGAIVRGPVCLEEDVTIKSGCYVEGPAYIGKNSTVGPNSRVRPHSSIDANVRVGASCEIKNSIIMAGSKVPHLSYIGDSVIGENCNLAAGTITANIRLDEAPIKLKLKGKMISSGRRKLGTIMGNGVQTGINASIMPGVRVGPNSFIGPGVVLYDDVPANHSVFLRQSLLKIRKKPAAQGRRD